MTWEYEEKAWANGYGSVCGVDEAGRGPVADRCALPQLSCRRNRHRGAERLEKLSEKKREKLFDEITENALAWSVSLVDERVIDEINILQATYRAMKQAVDGLTRPADFVYVDGNRSQGLEQSHECVVSGDAKIPSVAAASIIAKVTRDRLMRQFAEQYPQYGFEKHKGYETKAHDEALLEHGPMPDPPDDLPQEILRKASGCTAMKGAWGEKAARLYLEKRGWHTAATNFRTRFGEIDIIAENAQYVIFAEVKTRQECPLRSGVRSRHTGQAGEDHRRCTGVAAGAPDRKAAAV